MKTKNKAIISFIFILCLLALSGCGCKPKEERYAVDLEVWGFLDDREAMGKIFENYKTVNSHLRGIEYKKLTVDTYKKEVIDALASGQGPDIFLVHNTWLEDFSDKIVPAPDDILNEQKFRNDFVDVAVADFLGEGKVWAVPLSVDSLGLYYNKDLFNEAGITSPPKDWNAFIEDVKKLTKIDSFGNITQAGAAIGTAYNINRSTDILNLLMFQNQTEMMKDGRVYFDGEPGENALDFYTQFARLSSPNYCWNPQMHYSVDAFAEGTAAMMFNYSWQIPTIESKSPKLSFAVAPIPQFSTGPAVNYANYWAYGVAKNKTVERDSSNNQNVPYATNEQRIRTAWDFLSYLTTKHEAGAVEGNSSTAGRQADPNFDPAWHYAEETKRPAGRRDLIEKQKTDPKIGVFATDNLIARSWRQKEPEAVEAIFAEMIDQVNRGQFTAKEALRTAASRVEKIVNGR